MEKRQELTKRSHCIRQLMHEHVQSRLKHALSKLEGKKDDAAIRQKKKSAEDKYQLDLILEKGANAASKIVVASHIAKGTHPDLKVKNTSNLKIKFSMLPSLHEMGSHTLNTSASLMDASGDGAYNSAAYELYLLLDCEFDGRTLGQYLQQNDEDVIDAFQVGTSDKGFAMKCCSLLDSKCSKPAVNTLSKQIYWLENDADPSDDGNFEVLVPLFPASLVHQAYLEIQAHRFGEANKAARAARRERKAHDGVFHDYPGLAVQKMGGTKPQNISQLNSERGGVNYLLSSLPPQGWESSNLRLPVGVETVFGKTFGGQSRVFYTVGAIQKFLATNPPKNKTTRIRLKELVGSLTEEVVRFAAGYQQILPAGWTDDEQHDFSKLNKYEQLWLDPMRATLEDERPFMEKPQSPDMFTFGQAWEWKDWPVEITKAFAAWLSRELGKEFGDVETRQWQKMLLTSNFFKNQLRELRAMLGAPNYIPISKTHTELVDEKEDV